jgi:hypothetical protein
VCLVHDEEMNNHLIMNKVFGVCDVGCWARGVLEECRFVDRLGGLSLCMI